MEKKQHWPTLNTIIMVEDCIRAVKGNEVSVAELKRMLPRKVNHNSLMIILKYLEGSDKIISSLNGIKWSHNKKHSLLGKVSGENELNRNYIC